MDRGPVARVILDSPLPHLDRPFDYRVPSDLADQVVPGIRVSVPFRGGSRLAQGWVLERASTSDYAGQLAPIHAVTSPVPVLTPELAGLARAVADRQAGTMADVLRLAIPPRHVGAERKGLDEPGPQSALPPAVEVAGYARSDTEVLTSPGSRVALGVNLGLVATPDGTVTQWASTVAQIAQNWLAQGYSAIIAVPDFRDLKTVRTALNIGVPADRVVALEARQPPAERYRQYISLLRPDPRIIVGNRSAIYAPAYRLGAILLWDDADTQFVEPHAPGMHGRDLALLRSDRQKTALIFGAHLASLDVLRLRELGYLQSVEPQRKDRARVVLDDAKPGLSSQAFAAARQALSRGPVLLQVAKPGFTTGAVCAECRSPARCERCAGPLYFAQRDGTPSCRVCAGLASTWVCSTCRARRIVGVGAAAGRTAEDLGRAFPGVPVIVADGNRPVLHVADRPSLVIATPGAEPVAEAGYRAVVLLDAARTLAREGLRVPSEAARSWLHAAGLAHPGAKIFLPDVGGPLVRAFATGTLSAWLASQLAEYRSLRLPPAVRVATVRGRPDAVAEALVAIDQLRSQSLALDVLGPIEDENQELRYTIRFEYAIGAEIARELKALLVRQATRGRRPVVPGSRSSATLRVRFDDAEAFA